MHTARAEMVVASQGMEPLAVLTFEPDPLEPLVDALGQLRPELGDVGEVHVDLVPLTAGEMRRYRRRAIADSLRCRLFPRQSVFDCQASSLLC